MAQYSIHFLEPAEIELHDAYDLYEEQIAGLGGRFIGEVSDYLDSVADNPFKYQSRYGIDLRFAPLKIFPFVIAYSIDKDARIIHVVSVFHTSRNPKKFFT